MIRGGKVLLVSAGLAAAGCTATPKLEVRAIPDPAAKYRYGGGLLAEGRGQLAVGAVGTALETFRKLQREQPASPDAFAGIAACYAAMGRYDLERQNYELALAYAPHDPALLGALASSLARQGEVARAAEIRQEIARMAAPVIAKPQPQEAQVVPMAVPAVGSVTVKLPPVSNTVLRPVPLASNVRMAEPAPQAPEKVLAPQTKPSPATVEASMPVPSYPSAEASIAATPLGPFKDRAAATQLARTANVRLEASVTKDVAQAAMPVPRPGSITVKLPPVRPAVIQAAAISPDVKIAAAAPDVSDSPVLPAAVKSEALDPAMKPKERKVVAHAVPNTQGGPYLERLSQREVALVTKAGPLWRAPAGETKSASRAPKAQATSELALASSVRWVPLGAGARPAIQLLNAARSDGLAASTRTALVNRGWRKITIGNARNVREHSVVLYSPMRAILGRRLAAQFGCKAMKVEGGDKVLVLLGRDAAIRRTASSRA